MKEPRRSWMQVLERLGIPPRSGDEEAFIQRQFPGVAIGTFRCDLSRGFTAERGSLIENVCRLADYEYNEANWIRPKRETRRRQADIRYTGGRIASSQAFYDELVARYRLARHYECVRVGGLFSRNRTSFSEFDDQGLALKPNVSSIRMPYLRIFWLRMQQGLLAGNAVHVVRTMDRLVELWACAEVLRSLDLHETNRVYMAPIAPPPAPLDYPVMGIRVIDGEATLLSIPAARLGESQYSSWLASHELAAFAAQYVHWARQCSYEITSMPSAGITEIMAGAFENLRHTHAQSANYGPIDTFEKAKVVKDRMIALALAGVWFPVIA